jgi:hypothetical protein
VRSRQATARATTPSGPRALRARSTSPSRGKGRNACMPQRRNPHAEPWRGNGAGVQRINSPTSEKRPGFPPCLRRSEAASASQAGGRFCFGRAPSVASKRTRDAFVAERGAARLRCRGSRGGRATHSRPPPPAGRGLWRRDLRAATCRRRGNQMLAHSDPILLLGSVSPGARTVTASLRGEG